MDPDAVQRKKSEEKRKRVILRAVEYLPDLLDAEAAVIMMVDPERPDELHSIGEGTLPSFRSDRSVGKFSFSQFNFDWYHRERFVFNVLIGYVVTGVMGQVSRTGQYLNIPNIKKSEYDATLIAFICIVTLRGLIVSSTSFCVILFEVLPPRPPRPISRH